ncbi:MAG: nucleoside triphosphate pyrophosphohydrolase family protein [Alphaproteobacteria bacterium]|nr:nucleoside triphosphate pyrophosphohydrolase family protein [Alphaproteobacteria bacterium]
MSEIKDFFKNYSLFVDSVTSPDSKDDALAISKIKELSLALNGNYSRFDTAISGLVGEAGECADLWKKIKYHRKNFDEDTRKKMIDELGDVCWYLANAAIALGVDWDEIITRNIEKLQTRHPNGFSPAYMQKKP